MRKFGHGAYERVLRNETRPSIEHTRDFFLQAVSDIVPEVLDDLGNEPFELYKKTPAICYEADEKRRAKASDIVERYIWTAYERPPLKYIEKQWRDPFSIRPSVPLDEDGSIAVFKESLLDWSRRHNLNALWCRERAYATLDLWCYSPECHKARIWQHEPAWQTIMASSVQPDLDFVFRHRTEYPRQGFRQEVKQRILAACEERLDAFLDYREKAAQESGLVATQQRRFKEHFEWLVLRRIKKPQMTCKQIFDLYQAQSESLAMPRLITTVRAVEKAVKELADFIGLPACYAGRGRKPDTAVERR